MSSGRVLAAVVAVAAALPAPPAIAGAPARWAPAASGFYGNVYTAFQANTPLRRPFDDDKKVFPFYQYLDVHGYDPAHGLSSSAFVRAREVANGDDVTLDVYNANLEYRGLGDAGDALQVRAGRQVLAEGTNFLLMDGAYVRAKPLRGLDVVAYGGYQDADLQPYPEKPERSFGVFGATLRSTQFLGALATVGYHGLTPQDSAPRHFVDLGFKRAVPYTDFADVYSRVELDVGEAVPAFANVGVGLSLARPLYLNLEYDSYEPDPDQDRFLQDRIFDVFALDRLQEARIGITYKATRWLDVSSSYSFATYDKQNDHATHGHIAKLGFNWNFWRRLGLRAFNGVYLIDGGGDDRAVGVNCGVSEEILRGLEIHGIFAFANFDSITGKHGNAYSYIIGTQYLVVRNVSLLAEMEYNTNPDFEVDVRGNFGLTYTFSWS
ncbi:MAG: hypothetical protein B6D46_00070 [Polyangiaceae bacterium UTPRO1]|jgi:hypothetical protein|nr:hypothetical protein [Myxococcales bacterium]OQY69370.1 MAG: hypothetical protein B6D46_00070 [Polyangiaceae bacterium UTPRO1]